MNVGSLQNRRYKSAAVILLLKCWWQIKTKTVVYWKTGSDSRSDLPARPEAYIHTVSTRIWCEHISSSVLFPQPLKVPISKNMSQMTREEMFQFHRNRQSGKKVLISIFDFICCCRLFLQPPSLVLCLSLFDLKINLTGHLVNMNTCWSHVHN